MVVAVHDTRPLNLYLARKVDAALPSPIPAILVQPVVVVAAFVRVEPLAGGFLGINGSPSGRFWISGLLMQLVEIANCLTRAGVVPLVASDRHHRD